MIVLDLGEDPIVDVFNASPVPLSLLDDRFEEHITICVAEN